MLSDKKIREFTLPAGKAFHKLVDGKGMYLFITATARSWRYDYRFKRARRTLPLGLYPDVPLKAAREFLTVARETVAAGRDPCAERKAARVADSAVHTPTDTFQVVAEAWVLVQGYDAKTLKTARYRLQTYLYPELAQQRCRDITTPMLYTVLAKVEAAGLLHLLRRLKGMTGSIFRRAIVTGLATIDPTLALIGAFKTPKKKNHPAIKDPRRFGELLRAADTYDGELSTRYALRIEPLVILRSKELRGARGRELDLVSATWTVPAARMKSSQPHIVPLSRQAVVIFKEWYAINPWGPDDYVFPGNRSGRPLSGNTLNMALRIMGFPQGEMCVHGYRTVASTAWNSLGWKEDWSEMQLAHMERDEVRGAYNFADYLPQRILMMQALADYYDTLRTGTALPVHKSASTALSAAFQLEAESAQPGALVLPPASELSVDQALSMAFDLLAPFARQIAAAQSLIKQAA